MRRHDIPEDILRDALGLDPDEPRYAVTPLRQLPRNESTPTFPTNALPAPAKRLVDQAAKAIGCPPDAIALAALVALGSAIGNSRVVQPKRNWSEGAAIYGAVIAESGEKKTAAVGAATQAIQKLEHRLQREHETAMEEFAREVREYKVEEKDAHKSGLAAPPPPRKPDAERVLTNDPTIEALIPILKENPRGLLLERDELVGWVKGMDQYKSGGKGSERQFWLSTWSGRPVCVDRKSQQGPVSVLKPFIGVIGGVQPDVLEDLAENREDGMLERFLFAYPGAINAKWTDDDISDTTLAEYRALHERLRELSMKTDDEGDPIVGALTFSPDAQEAYMLRLTLIVACCRFASEARGVAERVELEDVLRATKLTDYFKEQARRVFGTLRGYDEKKRLLEHVATFVEYVGGTWVGTATDLHNKLPYVHKPNRPDELSRFLKEAAHDEESFTYQSKTERIKSDEGEWESHRVLTLTIENGVTA